MKNYLKPSIDVVEFEIEEITISEGGSSAPGGDDSGDTGL